METYKITKDNVARVIMALTDYQSFTCMDEASNPVEFCFAKSTENSDYYICGNNGQKFKLILAECT